MRREGVVESGDSMTVRETAPRSGGKRLPSNAQRGAAQGAVDLGPRLRADPLHRRPAMGRRRRETGTGSRHLLAHRHRALLPAVRDRGRVAQSRDAARRRALPMGQARLQRVLRLHRRLESLAVRHPEHDERRAAVHAVRRLHPRAARRGPDGAELGHRDGGRAHHRRRWSGSRSWACRSASGCTPSAAS